LQHGGFHIPSEWALDIFAEHGAQVDRDKKMVRLDPELVKKAMSSVP
jgi:trimethylamine:corrinoid methyltransferase-like protein